jgi:hypothetical protein
VRSDDPDTDADPVEHFLVDGVAPPVIGEGPPEPGPDPWEDSGPRRTGQDAGVVEVARRGPVPRHEPSTAPIPVIRPLPPEAEREERTSWVAKLFRSSRG